MDDTGVNLLVLSPSRKRRKPGEIFVLSVKEGQYYWGRVIALNTHIGWHGTFLAYIYNTKTRWKNPIPLLDKTNLLIPPFGTDNLVWSRGYFETVEYRLLTDDDVLQQHCFVSHGIRGYPDNFFDENGNPMDHRIEPCGTYGLATHYGIDKEVSNALGIPLASD